MKKVNIIELKKVSIDEFVGKYEFDIVEEGKYSEGLYKVVIGSRGEYEVEEKVELDEDGNFIVDDMLDIYESLIDDSMNEEELVEMREYWNEFSCSEVNIDGNYDVVYSEEGWIEYVRVV